MNVKKSHDSIINEQHSHKTKSFFSYQNNGKIINLEYNNDNGKENSNLNYIDAKKNISKSKKISNKDDLEKIIYLLYNHINNKKLKIN